MKPTAKFSPLIIFLFALPITLLAQEKESPVNQLFSRKYKQGETYRYKLTMSEYHDSKPELTNIAVCELKVIDRAGVPYDEIRWVSKKLIKGKDTIDQTQKAILVKPYYISLSSKGKIDLPKIEISEMTEPIEDFNTFFVAVSPMIHGVDQLKKRGDSVAVKDPVKADFSNGSSILKGEDCIDVTIKLVDFTPKEAFVYSAFMAPKQPCLTYLLSEMNTPVVANSINNFQMVAPFGKDKFLINYGREYFYINSTIRRSDGKITNATMFNQLNLKVKVNCDSEYKNCQLEIPLAEERKLTLELL